MDRRAQDRARFVDNASETLRTVKELHSKLANAPALYRFLENFLRANKCLNVALLFYKNELYSEALSMNHQVKQLANDCLNK